MAAGAPSHLRAVVRLAIAAARRRGGGHAPAPVEPARKRAVERHGIEVDRASLRRYLAATVTATGASPTAAVPPLIPSTYSSVWETALTLELLAQEGMPFPSQGVVHLSSSVVVLRPLGIEERIRVRLELERMEAHRRGVVMVLKSRLWNAAGRLCQENETTLLLRGCEAPPGATRVGEEGRAEVSGGEDGSMPPEWREIAAWRLPGDAGVRYARASGDYNPIHLWSWSARLAGFPRPILHGHCIVAMIASELRRACGGEPRKLEARFRSPLELPGEARLEIANGSRGAASELRLISPGGAGKPLVEGRWVGGGAG
jgi:acyl dehydratase